MLLCVLSSCLFLLHIPGTVADTLLDDSHPDLSDERPSRVVAVLDDISPPNNGNNGKPCLYSGWKLHSEDAERFGSSLEDLWGRQNALAFPDPDTTEAIAAFNRRVQEACLRCPKIVNSSSFLLTTDSAYNTTEGVAENSSGLLSDD